MSLQIQRQFNNWFQVPFNFALLFFIPYSIDSIDSSFFPLDFVINLFLSTDKETTVNVLPNTLFILLTEQSNFIAFPFFLSCMSSAWDWNASMTSKC